jgi:hypothetical protein
VFANQHRGSQQKSVKFSSGKEAQKYLQRRALLILCLGIKTKTNTEHKKSKKQNTVYSADFGG